MILILVSHVYSTIINLPAGKGRLFIFSLFITMSWNNILGKRGEELAVRFLEKKDYQILETNWRYRRAELDIIAKDGEVLVFVEVKTKNNNQYGDCLLYTSPSPRDATLSRMPSSA